MEEDHKDRQTFAEKGLRYITQMLYKIVKLIIYIIRNVVPLIIKSRDFR